MRWVCCGDREGWYAVIWVCWDEGRVCDERRVCWDDGDVMMCLICHGNRW